MTVRNLAGQLSTVTRTLYRSRYGPVLGTGWTAAYAFAVRDAGADNLRSVDEWLAMGRSENLAQFRAAQDAYQGLPWTYTLAADTSGTVYFADASVAPNVTAALEQRCQVGQLPGDILNGSTSACGWGSDPDAIEPGIFGPGHYPQLTRTDFVANSNNSPELANPAAPLAGYQPIYDPRRQLELRPRLSLDMISERLAGTDGYGPPGFTLTSLQETMLGQRNYSADLARAAVVAMCHAHPVLTATDGSQVDVRAACSVLDAWNGRAGSGSRGEVLWQQAYGQLNYIPGWWRVPFNPAQPLTTPRDLNAGDPEVQHALAEAVEYFPGPRHSLGHPARCRPALRRDLTARLHRRRRLLRPRRGCRPPGSAIGTDASNGSTFIMATELRRTGRAPGPSSPTPNSPTQPPRTTRTRPHCSPAASGSPSVHRSRNQRRPPATDNSPARLTPIGLTPCRPRGKRLRWPYQHCQRLPVGSPRDRAAQSSIDAARPMIITASCSGCISNRVCCSVFLGGRSGDRSRPEDRGTQCLF